MTPCPPPATPQLREGATALCRSCGQWFVLDFDRETQRLAWRPLVPIEAAAL